MSKRPKSKSYPYPNTQLDSTSKYHLELKRLKEKRRIADECESAKYYDNGSPFLFFSKTK